VAGVAGVRTRAPVVRCVALRAATAVGLSEQPRWSHVTCATGACVDWRCFGRASALVAAAVIEAIVMIASAARFNIPVTCLEERHWRR
jgi:hypothetical protein